MKRIIQNFTITLFLLLLTLTSTIAQDKHHSDTLKVYLSGIKLGGPSSVRSQLDQDGEQRKNKSLEEADEWLKNKTGISLGSDYNITLNQISESPQYNAAAGGVFRFYGHWNPGKDKSKFTGNLIFKVENRHKYGSGIAPQLLGPYADYAGLTATTFSDVKWVLTNFYWTQSFFKNRFAFNIGIVDFTDYVNIYGLINVWTDFNNLSYATGPTFILPNQGLGAVVRFMFSPKYYIIAGLADVNGDPHNPGDVFSSFFGDAQFFTHVEVGRISYWDNRFTNNTHLTLWHADESKLSGAESGWGMAFSWSQSFDQWLTFVRAEFSEGNASILNKSVSIGTGYQFKSRNDFFGIGLNWGQAPKDLTNEEARNQYTIETYYRVQVLKQVSIWPSIQYFINPAYNPDLDNLWLLGLRLRAAL